MRVLGLCSYPVESAATRYRLTQFVEPLAQAGIELDVSSFLSSSEFDLLYKNNPLLQKAFGLWKPLYKRISELNKIKEYDLLIVQREAMIFGPAFFEWIFQKAGNIPLILDLDDATYIRYVSPTYGKVGSFFKFFGKTDNLIKRAETVICGNRFIADYVEKKGTKTVVIPTVVDTDKFQPIEKANDIPVIGWIGTHSTFPLLESIFPVLRRLAEKHRFVLKIVGSGRDRITVEGVAVENLAWNLERETLDFQSLDIGLYPIKTSASASNDWIMGKSGFKAIQYMAVGIPFVVSPIGVCAEIGVVEKTHFSASTLDEWERHLSVLLNDIKIRRMMGANGRKYAVENYTVEIQTGKIIDVLRTASERHRTKVI